MNKYIDAEKLKERVTRLIASARQNDWPLVEDYLRRVIDIIDSLQQEQPSLPDNLDEAAETYSKEVSNGHSYRDLICGFKAGAEWMEKEINKELIKAMEKVHEIRDVDYDIHVDTSTDGSFETISYYENGKLVGQERTKKEE